MSLYDHLAKDLLPCPFCGSTHDAPIEEVVQLVMNEDEFYGMTWTVQCDKCTATMGYMETPEEAVDAWNRRSLFATSPINEIIAERRRQIEVEGRTADHDDRHKHGELARAASAYAGALVVAAIEQLDRAKP